MIYAWLSLEMALVKRDMGSFDVKLTEVSASCGSHLGGSSSSLLPALF